MNQQLLRVWANAIRRWGVEDWVASLLEAAGPLSVLGAQAIYLGQPLFNLVFSDEHLEQLAWLLEEPSQTRAFVAFLREEQSP